MPASSRRTRASLASPKAALTPHFRAAVKDDGVLELSIYEEIGENYFTGGGVTAQAVKQQLDATNCNRIVVRINSPGGDAFEGVAIRSLLRSQNKPVDVYVDGIAASAAAIVAMAGDNITMASGAMLMIHNAWSMCIGDGKDMMKMADTLNRVSASIAQVFVDRTGKPLAEVSQLMDDETWMSAEDSLKQGFSTAIVNVKNERALALARNFKALNAMKHVPSVLLNKAKTKKVDGEDLAWDDFIVASDHDDTSTWHLPWHFSDLEKTKAHLRDALARFNQVEGLSEDEKHASWTKLVHLCKKYGIEVSEKDATAFSVWAKKKNSDSDDDETGDQRRDDDTDEDGSECDCNCNNCVAENCNNCSAMDCKDEACMDCPMQKAQDCDGDGMSDKTQDTAALQASAVAEPEASNLNQFEARLRLLGRRTR